MTNDSIVHIRTGINEVIEGFQMLVSPSLDAHERLSFRAKLYYGALAHLHLYLQNDDELHENLPQVRELLITRVETLKRDLRGGELTKNRYAHRLLELLQSSYGEKDLITYVIDSITHLDKEHEALGSLRSLAEQMSIRALQASAEHNNRYYDAVLYPELRDAVEGLQEHLHELLAKKEVNSREYEGVTAKSETLLNAWLNLGSFDESETLSLKLQEIIAYLKRV